MRIFDLPRDMLADEESRLMTRATIIQNEQETALQQTTFKYDYNIDYNVIELVGYSLQDNNEWKMVSKQSTPAIRDDLSPVEYINQLHDIAVSFISGMMQASLEQLKDYRENVETLKDAKEWLEKL